MKILDNIHLDSLQCSKCHKYLSVFPVKNHLTRDVTCGRCSSDNDDDEGVRSYLYELIAEKYLFRCVNRYEGCRKLLRVEETEAHEKICVGKLVECPICRDDAAMNVLKLIWHYKVQHPASYLKKNYFEGKVPVKDVMLYIQDEIMFLILFEYDLSSNILCLNAATLTEANVSQTYVITQGSFCRLFEKRSSKPINTLGGGGFYIILNSVELIKFIFNLEVTESDKLYDISMPSSNKLVEKSTATATASNDGHFLVQLPLKLKKDQKYELNDSESSYVDNLEITLTCSNCVKVIRLPVFRCSKSQHQICYNCRTWCGICDSRVVQCRSNDLLLHVSSHLKYACKWKCGGYFTADINIHENVCKLGIKSCPICPSKVLLKSMQHHLFSEHQKFFHDEYDPERVSDLIYNNKKGDFYFILNDKWCRLNWYFKCGQHYYINFALCSYDSNVKLHVISPNLNFSRNRYTKIAFGAISSCRPYLTFVYE